MAGGTTAFWPPNGLRLNIWELTRDWSEDKRYHRIDKAEALRAAVADAAHGVFPWIKAQW